jgi:hypothetical protein
MRACLAAALACALAWLAAGRAQSRPNVLLITLDTVRADRIGAYGYAKAATPALDRLARDGVRFADATSQAPLTGPAHAALLTGVYPTVHRATAHEAKLSKEVPFVAEDMKKVEQDLRSGRLEADTIERQQKILSRLLDAPRSLEKRDYSRKRTSRPGVDVVRSSPEALSGDLLKSKPSLAALLARDRFVPRQTKLA